MTVKELAIKLKDLVAEGKGDLNVVFYDDYVTKPILYITERKNEDKALPVYHWISLSYEKLPSKI